MVRVQYMSGIVRTRGLVTSPGSRQADVRPFPPTLAWSGAYFLSGPNRLSLSHLRDTVRTGSRR